MKNYQSSDASIVHINKFFYVYKINAKTYEVRKHNGTHSYVVGSGTNLKSCIRTADNLAKYPHCV